MGEITLHFDSLPADVHECTSHREGEWITWRCPHCDGYERRYNWQTGEMRIRRGNSTAQHTGLSSREQNMDGLTKVIDFN
jgi:hypothetical protein